MTQRSFTATSFQAYLDEHKFMGSRCTECGAVYLPPRPLCPACYSEAMAWQELSGEGKLAAFTAVHIGSSAMIAAGYDRTKPYVSGVVRLAEGPSISAQILGVDAAHPETIAIDTPLRVTFVERRNGEKERTFLAFTAD